MVAAAGVEIAPGVTRVFAPSDVTRLQDLVDEVGRIDGSVGEQAIDDDAVRIDQLDLLERLKSAAEAAQARVIVAFERSQLERQRVAGVRRDCQGRGIGDQVAMACRQPTSQGPRRLGFAKAVVGEMPHTHALLTEGSITSWVATILVRETACLTREDRTTADERLCATTVAETGEVEPPRVLGLSPRRVENAARKLAAELDVEAVVRRNARAERDRRVTVRPAPDTMSYVTGLLPVAQGVAVYASLRAGADASRAAGDQRSVNQLMADLLVERVTGQASAGAVPTRRPGFVAASPTRSAAWPPPPTPDGVSSAPPSSGRSTCATARAGCRAASPRSSTTTTSSATPTAARQRSRTAKVCARVTTSPRRSRAGGHGCSIRGPGGT